ncbi:aminotransferase class I/II-fold pyridoxal phosphate-dependent enzyme [Coprobacter sp.]
MRNTYFENRLKEITASGNLRTLLTVKNNNKYILCKNRQLINLASNDYLGIATTQSLFSEFIETVNQEDIQFSASSSRLQTGNYEAHIALEKRLSALYNSETALVFNSGYHANAGILPAITTTRSLILADKLVHASIIDGIRLSLAKCIRFRHNDYVQLERLLQQAGQKYDNIIIVTESIFSMDGDEADLQKLVQLKYSFPNVMLYIDEAHAVGVRGLHGLGCCEEQNVIEQIDFLIGTFGKALGSCGAYLICSKTVREYLINTMRTFIFTTALPPINSRWTLFALNKVITMDEHRKHLQHISYLLRKELNLLNGKIQSSSHIIPYVTGSSAAAYNVAKEIRKQGFFVLPVRPPTVPEGTSRIRISLTANCTENEVNKLINCIRNLRHNETTFYKTTK